MRFIYTHNLLLYILYIFSMYRISFSYHRGLQLDVRSQLFMAKLKRITFKRSSDLGVIIFPITM